MSDAARERARAQVRLSELRERFGARLHERLEQLAALVERARADATSDALGEALGEALGAAHRLAGTAGSYGFEDVGEAAAALERALQRIAGGEGEWDAALASLSRARQAGR